MNGEPGVVFTSGGAVIQVVALCIEGGVRAVYMTDNPDKLVPLVGGGGRIGFGIRTARDPRATTEEIQS